ncbi:MAG: hypothetical protein ABIJ95_00815, partial [Pseudomonadota bacterium]
QEDGRWVTRMEPAEKSKPGDVILYTIHYVNQGDEPAQNAEITDPVPGGTEYLFQSAGGEGSHIYFSVDGGMRFQDFPAMVPVTLPDGRVEDRPASADQYTHVKWVLINDLPPKGSGTAYFKVTVK